MGLINSLRRGVRKEKALDMNVEFTGLELLDKEKFKVSNLIAGFSRQERTRNFHIHIKNYEKDGRRQKYVVNVEIISDFGKFTSQDVNWNMLLAVRKAIRKVERQLNEAERKTKRRAA